jgi:flagellar motor switch protein FliN
MLTTQEALVSLATAGAGAAAEALRAFAPDEVGAGPVSVTQPGRDPLDGVEAPVAIASGPYAGDGSTVFVMPIAAARRLAAAVSGEEPGSGVPDELGEAELGALGQAAERIIEAVAIASAAALELDGQAAPVAAEVRVARTSRDVKLGFPGTTRATVAIISLYGEACRLVQLVPSGHATRMTQASGADEPHGNGSLRQAVGATLRGVPLRVWAEVGRARLRSAEVASLSDGAIIELDRAADDPVDLYVNGSRIATGRLICIDGKEWAVRLEAVFAAAEADSAAA